MTVDSTTNRKDYDPDGVVVAFPYNFRVDDADDMVVKEDGVVVVGGYTVSGVGEEAGGDVTFDVAPLVSVELLTLIREVPLTQQTAYPALGPFPAGSHEAALDKLTFINQQQQEQLDRAVLTETAQGPLSLPDPEAGKRLQWKDDLSGFDNVDSGSEEAEAAAAAAEVSAAEAEASSLFSQGAASAASVSAVASQGYANSASGSADDAAASAAQAAIDAAAVADKASVDEVEAFKDDAEAAAIAAGVSAAAASASAADAGLSELNASNSQTSAGFSETAASDSADAAAISAANAAAYDPTWEAWQTATVVLADWNVLEAFKYRRASDGSNLQIRGKVSLKAQLTAGLRLITTLPSGYVISTDTRIITAVLSSVAPCFIFFYGTSWISPGEIHLNCQETLAIGATVYINVTIPLDYTA